MIGKIALVSNDIGTGSRCSLRDSSCLTPRTFVAQTFEAGPLMPVRGCDN
jgi:hypothetical protein